MGDGYKFAEAQDPVTGSRVFKGEPGTGKHDDMYLPIILVGMEKNSSNTYQMYVQVDEPFFRKK
jgi:hypothetical protein